MIEVGKKFGRLVVRTREGSAYRCDCSCGRQAIFTEDDLPAVKSCGCIVILGLDLATNCGWAVRYSWRSASAIKCGVFSVGENNAGEDMEWEEKYALAGNQVYRLIKEHNPDFVVIEQPEHSIRRYGRPGKGGVDPAAIKVFIGRLSAVLFKHGLGSPQAAQAVSAIAGGSNNSNQMQLAGIAGAAIAACIISATPYGTIGARSWHSLAYRDGTKPGEGEDWKDVAIRQCELEKIPLPATKKDKRDAAEAVFISGCWVKCNLPNFKWMRDRWMALRTNAYAAKARREGIAA
ncbi:MULTISPECIES: hypothetical protein [unclassified Rhizobium]|uniref:hypothetical protein n=1 Tax=unclassified Rhizobium TaxID=2613769 RepID=UPI0038111E82